MHAHELANLAAVVAVHGQQALAASPQIMDQSLAAYWTASRCRLNRWGRRLRSLTTVANWQPWPPMALRVIEEILVSELLTRSVAAIAVAHDQQHGQAESAPIGRNIATAHVDLRRRALAVAAAPHRDADQASAIFALRRQCDRWSDLLLAYLAPHAAIDEFAASPARVNDFAYDARGHLQSAASSDMAVTMILAGMRSSLAPLSDAATPNADLNVRIAAAVVGLFSVEFFDSHGLSRSAWLEQLRSVPNETPARLDQWWQPSSSTAAKSSFARWRR